MASVARIVSAYRADREPIVVDTVRLESCCKHLRRLLGRTQASRLNRARLNSYVRRRIKEGVQPQTVRREFIVLRAALRLALRDRKIRRLPVIELPPKGRGRQKVLTLQEIRRLRLAVATSPPLALFVEIALATGARRGAILELTWDRVFFEAREIDFRAPHPRSERRKHRAVVPIDTDLLRLLKRAHKTSTSDRVIALSASQFDRHFRKAARGAGLKDVTPHVFRHTVATEVSRRVSLERASKLIGHKSIAVTQEVYEHLKPGDLRPAARAMALWLRTTPRRSGRHQRFL